MESCVLSLTRNIDRRLELTLVNISLVRRSNTSHWYAKTQTVNGKKWIKLQVLLPLCKANAFMYSQGKAFKWSTFPKGVLKNELTRSFEGASPCLLSHLILVSSGQLIQVGLQNGLHLLMVGRAERGRWGLAEGGCRRRRCPSSQGRCGTPLLLYLIVQTLVAVGLNG